MEPTRYPSRDRDADTPSLEAYLVDGMPVMPIVRADRDREWMRSLDRFPYRCLPLLVANQAGWLLLNVHDVEIAWNGGLQRGDLEVRYPDERPTHGLIASHFGLGVVTWHVPYLFRTSPGYNLWVRGPANMVKDGIQPLEGIVETDWSLTSFTMNWKVTRPSTTIRFEVDEPFAMIVPVRRGELESFGTSCERLTAKPELEAGHSAWAASRAGFLQAQREGRTADSEWQRDYFVGGALAGEAPADHQTKVNLASFSWERLRVHAFGWEADERDD